MASETHFAEVIQELRDLRAHALTYGDRAYASKASSILTVLLDAVDRLEIGSQQEIEVYRAAINGVLDLPWPGADVHNRYLHFVLDERRMPTDQESMTRINVDHERFYKHPFLQAEGLTIGQCRDCLEDPEGTQYGMPQS